MNKGLIPLAIVALATNLLAFGNNAAQAGNVECGDEIFVDTKLDANINCLPYPGKDGVMIGAPGIALNLNGFTMIGESIPGASGVFNAGWDEITIKNVADSRMGYEPTESPSS